MKTPLSIIIPVYNERYNIDNVLDNISKPYEKNVLIVDDGSNDGTYEYVKESGFKAVKLSKNKGKLNACLEGVKRSEDNCVFIDGDGQLNPKEIPVFVKELKNNDIVVGERSFSNIPIMRKLSNWYAKKITNYVLGTDFSDVLCGFRGVRKTSFKKMKFNNEGYFFELELLFQAVQNGMKIKKVPVSVSYDVGSRMPLSKSIGMGIWLFSKLFSKIKSDIYSSARYPFP